MNISFVSRQAILLPAANKPYMNPPNDSAFAGSIPELYETYLAPMLFEFYADDLARRVAEKPAARLLEIACGTGVASRRLAETLPAGAELVSTDLNQAMLDFALAQGTARPVEWRQADALALPFGNAEFDAVVCQFGAMFFPDRPRAYAEARRVLRPGGRFLFSVWDRIEENAFADVVTRALAERYPANPPRFLARTPHGYHDVHAVQRDLAAARYAASPAIQTLSAVSRAPYAEAPAIGYCHGCPLRGEIEAREPGGLDAATRAVADELALQFGSGPIEAKIQAHIVVIAA